MIRGKFDHKDYSGGLNAAELIRWLNNRMKMISQVLQGPVFKDWGSVAIAQSIQLNAADLHYLTLAGSFAITLRNDDVSKATVAYLELTQDATGGRVPTWTNAANAPTAPSAVANKKTMYHCIYTGTQWVVTLLTSGY